MKKMLGLLAAAALFASCANPFVSRHDKDGASLTITMAGASRTVTADLKNSVDGYDVTLTSQNGYATKNGTATGASGTLVIGDIEAGTWDISVAAKKGAVTVGTGTKTVTVAAGVSSTETVDINFTQAASTGALSLEVRFPHTLGIDYASGVIGSYMLTPIVVASAEAGYDCVTFTQAGLAGGAQDLVITLKKGGAGGSVAGIFREAVNVWDGVTSSSWMNSDGSLLPYLKFEETNLFNQNASLASLTLTGVSLPFSSSTLTYSDVKVSDQSSVLLNALSSVAGQKIEYRLDTGTWTELTSGANSDAIALTGQSHMIEVRVTAPDQATAQTYAVMLRKAYRVIYDGNGSASGTAPVDSSLYFPADEATILGNTGNLSKANYTFKGWATAPDGSGSVYQAGDTFVVPSCNVTLCAKWELNGSVKATFDITLNYPTISFTMDSSYISSGTTLSISTDNEVLANNGTDWVWKIDGVIDAPNVGSSGFEWTPDDSMLGKHHIFVSVKLNGVAYSGETIVTVTNGAPTYTVTYSTWGADGGFAPVPGSYESDATVTVPGNTGSLFRVNHTFGGWTDNPAGTGTVYMEGGTSYTMPPSNAILYPKWHPFSSGAGTEASPFVIFNAFQLNSIRGEYLNKHFILGENIDLASYANFEPIGDSGAPFRGVISSDSYTVNGHVRTISNLKITRSGQDNIGLFGCTNGATIQGLLLLDANVSGGSYVGALVGQGLSTTVRNCGVKSAGVGSVVLASGTFCGGLIGLADSGSSASACFSAAAVTGSTKVGGFVGKGSGMITNCYSAGSVSSPSLDETGGFVGNADQGTYNFCYSSCTFGSQGYAFEGLLAGTFTNCYYDSDVAGSNTLCGSAGVTGPGTAAMKLPGTYAGWDTGIWIITDGSYPSLGWEAP